MAQDFSIQYSEETSFSKQWKGSRRNDNFICFLTLVGHGILTRDDSVSAAGVHFDRIGQDCLNCAAFKTCALCKLNE